MALVIYYYQRLVFLKKGKVMLATVVNKRMPHVTQKGAVISKLQILANGKKAFIYCQHPMTETTDPEVTKLDMLNIGQQIVVENENGYYRLSNDQSVAQGTGTQVQNVQHVFQGTPVRQQKEALDGAVILKGVKLMANCINGIRSELPKEFSSEDCRSAGIALFIHLTKEYDLEKLPIVKQPPMQNTGQATTPDPVDEIPFN